MFLIGLLAFSSGILTGASGYKLWKEQQPPSFPLRAIQAVCTKANDCTIFLYEKNPKIQSVASGKSQELKPADTVIVRK